ncbi:MAG: cyclase [Myxococcota bacterium]|jgi:cyclase
MGGEVVVVSTGVANTASVCAALRRAGAEPVITRSVEAVSSAERLVLPGVGSFAAGMASLSAAGLVAPLRARLAAGRPTLAVCLGMQMLCTGSEEAPGVTGLGVLPVPVERLPASARVPHLGWSGVRPADFGPLAAGYACFAHSFAIHSVPEGWGVAWAHRGVDFVAAAWRGDVLACQFHPELSGRWGAALLARWLGGEPAPPDTTAGVQRSTRRVVPCLDVRDGRIVKGVRFQGLRDAGDPVERAALYAAQGADELVLLDVSATPEGRRTAAETVAAVRAVLDVPLTVGGGIRAVADAERLLAAGADKVGVNSAAVARPALLRELAERFGRQCVVLALDAARRPGGGWEVVVRSGRERTGRDAIAWARSAVALGAGEILLTSWDRDGTGDGYDLDLLAAITEAVSVPVIASGGASLPGHLAAALGAGADAALAASIFHDGVYTVAAVKAALAEAGVAIREEER